MRQGRLGPKSPAPASSDWFGGCVVAYTSDVKRRVLGVPDGPVVSKEAAAAMAEGVADLLGSDLAVAVTGVGGPEEQDGEPPGTVWFGICNRGAVTTEMQRWDAEPEQVLDQTTVHALTLLERALQVHAAPAERHTAMSPSTSGELSPCRGTASRGEWSVGDVPDGC